MLGLVDFEEVQQLQRRLVYDLGERGGASLVLCEHPPTISVGRSGSRVHIVARRRRAAGHGHQGPLGQPGRRMRPPPARPARRLSRPARWNRSGSTSERYLEGLHDAILGVLEEFELRGTTSARASPGSSSGTARVATVGVAVNRWIAYHGLDPERRRRSCEPFEPDRRARARPATPLRQTSMESRRQRPRPMPKVREALIRQLESRSSAWSGITSTPHHPLIRRKVRSHVYAQSSWMSAPACRSCPSWRPARSRRARPSAPRRRLPEWLKRPIPAAGGTYFTKDLVGELGLETICESARCPEPLGVLDPADRDVHDPGRGLHPPLRLLRRASAASPRPSPSTSPTAWPRPAPGSA